MWSRHLDNQLTSGPRPLCEGPPAFCTPPGIPACMGLNAVRMVSQARPSISGPVLYRRAPVIWRRAHYLAVGLTCPVSAGLGGKAGHGPSFTWKASSAIAREDFSSNFIGIIKPPARQLQEYVGTRAQENQLFPVAASGVDFGNAQCPDCHSHAARSETQTRGGCEYLPGFRYSQGGGRGNAGRRARLIHVDGAMSHAGCQRRYRTACHRVRR